MPQQTISIPVKSTDDLLTAAEFDIIHDAINANSTDLESQLSTQESQLASIGDRIQSVNDNHPGIVSSFATSDLPTNLLDGSMVYDKDSETVFYSNGSQFYRMSDNADLSTFTEVDMFIVMGQSNADGKGDINNLDSQTGRSLEGLDRTGTIIHPSSIDQGTREYVEGTWEQIDPGVNTTAQVANRFGPELGFSDSVKAIVDGGGNATYDKPVAILKFAKGSTSLGDNWAAPSGDCYTAMIQDIPNGKFDLGQANYKFNIRGMIWYQGESDGSNQTYADNYETNLNAFFADVRSRFNRPNLPIMVCQPWWDTNDGNYPAYLETVRTAQQNVADTDSYVDIIDTTGYARRDATHLNAKGQYELGEAIATQFSNIL